MKYQKLEQKNYHLHVIETNRFKTVFVRVNFKRKLKKEEIVFRNMLVNVLFESTQKYPTKRLMEIETEELYELGYRGSNYASGKYSVMSLDTIFLNPKYTEEGMLEESLAFLGEVLFHPNVDQKGFLEEGYQISYHSLEDYLESLKENPDSYAHMRLLEEMEPDTVLSYRGCGYLEDLKKVTRKKLYQYYQKVLKEDMVDIFAIGDIKTKEIEKLIAKYFPFQERSYQVTSHFYQAKKRHEQILFQKEGADLKQSKLLMGCQIKKATDFELRYVLNVFNYILGGSPNSKLFQNVREKHSLCYSISSSSQPLVSILTIKAGINAWEYDRACALILEQLEDMKNGKFEETEIENAITTYKNSLKSYEDNPESMLSLYAGMVYLNADTIEDRIKQIEKVDKESVMQLASKIQLDTIFFLEGKEEYEEEPHEAF